MTANGGHRQPPDGSGDRLRGRSDRLLGAALVGHLVALVTAAAAAGAARSAPGWVLLSVVSLGTLAVVCVLTVGAKERAAREARRARDHVVESERALASRLRRAEAAEDRLLTLASHELRTPVTAIVGLARTLAVHHAVLDRRRLAACVDGIEEHTERLSRLLDNLVAASGSAPARRGQVEVTSVVSSLVEKLVDGGVPFEVAVPPTASVALDGVAARRVLGNLLDNGRKFARPGTSVAVTARAVGADVEVAVTNVLRPGDEASLRALGDRVFQPFVQGDSSDTRTAEGLGLGLHVARSVTAAHGGRLELRVEAGRLAAVVTLPTSTERPVVDEEAPVVARA